MISAGSCADMAGPLRGRFPAMEVQVRNAETAVLRVTESQADAVRFIASLQRIAASCGRS
jgi:hypothetical protein